MSEEGHHRCRWGVPNEVAQPLRRIVPRNDIDVDWNTILEREVARMEIKADLTHVTYERLMNRVG